MEATQEDNGVVELDLRTELGNEILARSEGDILNQNNLSALSLAMGEYRIKTDDELLAEKLARQTFGTDINFAWDKHLSSFNNLTYLVRQHVDDTAAIMEHRYQELDQRVQKYENMLYDITMDSANFTMDRTDIEFSGWTILAQAAAWDNEILKKLANFKAEVDQSIQDSIDSGLDDVLSNVPDLEQWIKDAIDALGNSPIISDLYDLLNQADGKVDDVKDDFFQSLGALRTEALGELITLRNNIEKELRDYTDNLALEVEARHAALDTLTTALQTEIDDRIEAMESIASSMQGDIAERLAKIDELEDGLTTERNERTEAHDKLIQDITTYKSSTDNSLAVLQTDVKTQATDLEAITKEVKLLHANVGDFNSSILEEYATKADLNSTEASISTLMESKLNDSSNALSQKIDETKTSITKDLDGKITAQTKVTDGLKSTIDGNHAAIVNNYLTKVDTNKAITEAVNTAKTTLNSAIANEAGRIDKVTTSVSKVGDDLVALSDTVKTLNALVDKNQATLTENYYTKAKTDEAISGKVTQYTAKLAMQSKKATLVFTTETLPTLVTNAPTTPVAVSVDATAKAGSIITFGTGTGASEAIYTLAPAEAILMNPDKLYVVRYRFKRVSGTGGVYLGLVCSDESRTKNIAANAAEISLTSFGNSYYAVNNLKSTLGEWITGEYYFKGRVESGSATGGGTKANPRKLAAKAVYARPMFWASYQTQDTVTVCDYVELECVDVDTDEYATVKALTETKAEIIADADGKIKAVSSDLLALSGTVGDNQAKLINNYSTTVDMNKAISNATTSLSTRMDNLAIGGENLLKTTNWKTRDDVVFTIWGGQLKRNAYAINRVGGQTVGLRLDSAAGTGAYGFSQLSSGALSSVIAGKEYTLSFVGQGTFSSLNYCYLLYGDEGVDNQQIGNIPFGSGGSIRRSTTFTAANTSDKVRVLIAANRTWTATDWFSVAEVKLEEGNVATAWSSNPTADIATLNTVLSDAIDTLKVDVSKNADGITANANKTTLLEVKGSGDNVTNILKDPTFLNIGNTWTGEFISLFTRQLPGVDSVVKTSTAYPASTKALDVSGTANAYYGHLAHELVPVTADRKYSISGGIRSNPSGALGSIRVSVDLADSTGEIIRWQDLFTLDLSTATEYTTFAETFTVNEGEVAARFRYRFRYNSAGKLKTSLIAFPNMCLEVEPVSLSKAMTVLDSKYKDVEGVQSSQASLVTSLESKLDNQKIGGTNIIKGTQSGGFIRHGNANASTITEITDSAFKTSVYRVDRLIETVPIGVTTSNANKTGTLKNGREYIISFYARGTKVPNYVYTMGSNSVGTNNGRSVSAKATFSETDFVLCTGTFTANFDAIGKVGILVGVNGGAVGDWLEVAEVMIQEGNTATDWQDSYLDTPDLSDYATSTYVAGVKTEVTKDINDKIKVVADSTTVLQGKLDENTASIATQAKITDGLKAQYLVKMETNGVLAGFGLLQDTNVLGQVVSAFGVNADNFYIGAPATGKKPFIVTTKTTTINGVSYPAGTWIDVAFIATATIGTAHIADASITNAKIKDINADKITAGTIDAARIRVGSSTTFDTGYDPATNLQAAKDYTDIDSYSNMKTFNNVTGYSTRTSSFTNTLVIKTPLSPKAYMTKLMLSGYQYAASEETSYSIEIAFYAYNTSNPFTNFRVKSTGIALKDVSLALDSNGQVVILVNKVSAWRYPIITLDKAIIGYTTPPDSFKDGWSLNFETDVSAYTVSSANITIDQAETVQGSETKVAEVKAQLSEIAADNVLTPVEKKQVKTIWDSINVSNANLLAQAAKAGVSSSAYTTAYNTLNTYVTSLLSDMTTNSTVVRNTFNTNFSNVYTQIAALEKLINDAAFVGTEKVNSITSVVSNETVIEGGKIRTGTIAADKLSVTSLSAISANLGSISVGTANITNNAITNAKIADLSVNSAKIVDASITNAKIANLSVDSLKIRDQAVTVTVAGVGVSQLSINTDGGIVFIDIGIETNHLVSGGVSGSQYVRLYRNGSAIKTYSLPGTTLGEYLSWNICQTLATITDNPPKGSHVYSIKVTSSASTGVTESNLHTPASKTWVPLSGVSMRLLEIKK